MAERTLNEALSGAEIKEIILQEIEKRLNGDTTLENTIAYAGFTAKFAIDISYLRSLTKPTLVWGIAAEATSAEGGEPGQIAIIDSHTSNPSPDVERQNHDLAIPVLVQTPAGMEKKKVHVGRGPGRPKLNRDPIS